MITRELLLAECPECKRQIPAEVDVLRPDVLWLSGHDRLVEGRWVRCPRWRA